MAGLSPIVSRAAMTHFAATHLVRGKEARLDLDRNAQMLAPPLQLHEPVAA